MDERWIDRHREGGHEAGGAAGDPAAEEVDGDDRRQAEQQLDYPGGAFAGAGGRVEAGGVEQRCAGRPVAGVAEGRAAVAAFGVERLGEGVIGVGVVAG